MKLLLDTHLLLWAAGSPERLSKEARTLLDDPSNELLFSAASLWEVVIKRSLGREDFQVDARVLRRGLLDNGYRELPVVSDHVVAFDSLPAIHKDPFDRILIAQATVEGIPLLTTDALVATYSVPFGQCEPTVMRDPAAQMGRAAGSVLLPEETFRLHSMGLTVRGEFGPRVPTGEKREIFRGAFAAC